MVIEIVSVLLANVQAAISFENNYIVNKYQNAMASVLDK